jgi:transglutaminase/protease-like cytokinesis protein 3
VAHEWNLVNINGGLYHLDATFDAPVSASGKVITHNYFNVNDAEISKDHSWDTSAYPKAYAIAANYFVLNNLMADNKSKYYEIIKNQLIAKSSVITIRTASYDANTYAADVLMKVLKDNPNINYVDTAKGYSFSYDAASCVIEIDVSYK